MLSINTNLPGLIAQNSLKNSTLKLNRAVERMSTGYKINHAKDNAANYSIATDMTTKLGAYQVAEDNCAMGLDFIKTADDSLNIIQNNLSRLRALAEQAANGTYGQQSLKSINSEAGALVDEIERIYSTAEYNGNKLFGISGGSFIKEVKQRDTSSMTKLSSVDPTQSLADGTYSISTAEELAQLATMANNGKSGSYVEFVLANNIDLSAYSSGEGWTPIGNAEDQECDLESLKGCFDGNGYVISNLYINRPNEDFIGLFGSAIQVINLGLENVNITGRDEVFGLGRVCFVENCYVVGEVKGNNRVAGLSGGSSFNSYANCNVYGNDYVGGLCDYSIGGTQIENSYSLGTVTGNNNVGGLVGNMTYGSIKNSYSFANIAGNNYVGGLGGSTSSASIINSYAAGSVTGKNHTGGVTGDWHYDGAEGNEIKNIYYNNDFSGQNDTGKGIGVTTSELNELIRDGSLSDFALKTVVIPQETTFQVGINFSEDSQVTLNSSFTLNVSSLRGIGIGTSDYMSEIDSLLNTVSSKQTDYGAMQNRLESALDEISTQYENILSSRSTLRDADIAKVSSEYIRQQILQQASATLLSTANQSPALALQLL